MADPVETIRTRVLPAILTALGVVMLTAGVLTYADPTTAGTIQAVEPTIETLDPTDEPAASLVLPPGSPSAEPSGSPASSDEPTPKPKRAVATRVVVPALDIDLPVVKGNNGYPLCNVALYLKELSQPGEGRATYIYAHARDGMFGPIYRHAIEKRTGKKMLGMIVQVYTSDDKLYLYEIREVRLHQRDLDDALTATEEELWLQTSEGPKGTPGKTQLRATLLSVGDADHMAAHPKPKPVRCG